MTITNIRVVLADEETNATYSREQFILTGQLILLPLHQHTPKTSTSNTTTGSSTDTTATTDSSNTTDLNKRKPEESKSTEVCFKLYYLYFKTTFSILYIFLIFGKGLLRVNYSVTF